MTEKNMKRITYMDAAEQFNRQGVDRKDWAVICPMCGTVQSCSDLINAGAGGDLESVNPYFGYSCVGRFNEGKTGCDWTLGGLFQIHRSEVEKDGKIHPFFEIASAEQAQANVKKNHIEKMSHFLEQTKTNNNLPFIKAGMKVRDLFAGQNGKIIDGHRSGGLVIETEDGKVGNYHPTWKIRYYNDDGTIAAEFND